MREVVGRKLELREAELLQQYCGGSNTAVAAILRWQQYCGGSADWQTYGML